MTAIEIYEYNLLAEELGYYDLDHLKRNSCEFSEALKKAINIICHERELKPLL